MESFLNDQRVCYDAMATRMDGESWKQAHSEAMACGHVEDTIAIGLTVLANLRRWRELALGEIESHRKPFSWDAIREIDESFLWWLDRSSFLSKVVADLESESFCVAGADDLRKEVRDVTLMSLDVDHDRQSIASIEAGNGTRSQKAMDDLRHHIRRPPS